jgi:hypothetical protein
MSEKPNIWGTFVGEGGYQLPAFNSQKGPFPPKPNTEGYIAIGWPAVGDMNLYENSYTDFRLKFSKVYPTSIPAVANVVWNFAFEMKENDWVICPSAATGYLLVGKIISGYIPDFHNESGLYKFTDEVYLHLRKVNWLYIIPREDARYARLNRIGNLTVVQPNISIDTLESILNTNDNDGWSDTLIAETRNVLDLGFMPRDDFVYMKNINGNFGKIHITDWMAKKLLIRDSKTDAEYLYTTVDELIAAGWAAD